MLELCSFLDRVASSAHPPTRYTPKALQSGSGLDIAERKLGRGREIETAVGCEGLLTVPQPPHTVYVECHEMIFSIEFQSYDSNKPNLYIHKTQAAVC